MGEITTIGLDLAKQVFQVHSIDADGTTVLRKQLRRSQVLSFFSRLAPCLVGMEACATAHYWGRELAALGHEVRLMPAQYVKAYIKRFGSRWPCCASQMIRLAISTAVGPARSVSFRPSTAASNALARTPTSSGSNALFFSRW